MQNLKIILGTILRMVHSLLLHYYLCFPAHIGTGFQIQAVPMAQVNATVPTSAAPPAGKFNNIDSQIGTQVADGGPQQIASQTITSTGAVVQKPLVVPAVPVVPAIPTKPMTMTMNGMTMFKPAMTMTMPGMMNMGGPGGITMMRPGMPFMPWTMPGLPGTMRMNGKF